jgi:hypothetical protein
MTVVMMATLTKPVAAGAEAERQVDVALLQSATKPEEKTGTAPDVVDEAVPP